MPSQPPRWPPMPQMQANVGRMGMPYNPMMPVQKFMPSNPMFKNPMMAMPMGGYYPQQQGQHMGQTQGQQMGQAHQGIQGQHMQAHQGHPQGHPGQPQYDPYGYRK